MINNKQNKALQRAVTKYLMTNIRQIVNHINNKQTYIFIIQKNSCKVKAAYDFERKKYATSHLKFIAYLSVLKDQLITREDQLVTMPTTNSEYILANVFYLYSSFQKMCNLVGSNSILVHNFIFKNLSCQYLHPYKYLLSIEVDQGYIP